MDFLNNMLFFHPISYQAVATHVNDATASGDFLPVLLHLTSSKALVPSACSAHSKWNKFLEIFVLSFPVAFLDRALLESHSLHGETVDFHIKSLYKILEIRHIECADSNP